MSETLEIDESDLDTPEDSTTDNFAETRGPGKYGGRSSRGFTFDEEYEIAQSGGFLDHTFLDEFRVEEPELTHEMAKAEDKERTLEAASRVIGDKGVEIGHEALPSYPGTIAQEITEANGMSPRIVTESEGMYMDTDSLEVPYNAVHKKVDEIVDDAYATQAHLHPIEAFRGTPVTGANLAVRAEDHATRHQTRAEKAGEKAAVKFSKSPSAETQNK